MSFKSAAILRDEAEQEQQDVLAAARKFARRAAEEWGASGVYIFGSRARGDWRRRSDTDLMVVSERFAGMSQYDRSLALGLLWTGPVGCEPMGFTPEEWEMGRKKVGIVSMALEDGVLQVWPAERRIREGLRRSGRD